MTEKIIVAGAGGQGIMLLGKVLATAALKEGRFVTWLPSYGAEVRGGTAHCMVVISSIEIGSPYIEKAGALIIMNAPSLQRFKNRITDKGLLIINSSLASRRTNKGMRTIQHPFTEIALKLGNIRVANMVALGCFIAEKNIVGLESISRVLSDIAPEAKKHLIEINKRALEEGMKLK
jgi:2-oxoglutarate ferredoxin oxidoreductase subunit gamma